jgi:hypothetical protein
MAAKRCSAAGAAFAPGKHSPPAENENYVRTHGRNNRCHQDHKSMNFFKHPCSIRQLYGRLKKLILMPAARFSRSKK